MKIMGCLGNKLEAIAEMNLSIWIHIFNDNSGDLLLFRSINSFVFELTYLVHYTSEQFWGTCINL